MTPLLAKRASVAATLDMSVRAFDRALAAEQIGPKPITLAGSTTRLWSMSDIQDWIAAARNGELLDRAEWEQIKRQQLREVKTDA